jgi:elongation factor Ts
VQKSLEEADWDLDKAYEVLRKRGLAAAAKKASRHAADGLVGVAVGPGAAAIVEVNSETDFVARNELFTGLVQQVRHQRVYHSNRNHATSCCASCGCST